MDGSITPDTIIAWFSDPVLGAAGIVGLVAWIRKMFPKIDGPFVVPAVAIAAGAIIGTLGQAIGWLAVEPFSLWGFPVGGATYGISLAITGVVGVNIFDLMSSKLGKSLIGLFQKGDSLAENSSTRTDADDLRLR